MKALLDRRLLAHFDWITMTVALALALIGLASIYSATNINHPEIYTKGTYWIILGVCAMLIAAVFDYELLADFAYLIYGASILLLIAVLFLGHGDTNRWLDLGVFNVQPSEVAKLALVIILAKHFSSTPSHKAGLGFRDLVIPGVMMIVPFLLVAKEPDLGTAMVMGLIFGSMVLVVKVRPRVIIGLTLMAAAVFPFAWKGLKAYQKARLLSFLTPGADPHGSGYHVMQSKIAIGSGGFFGKGFLKGTQGKLLFLPEHYTDFIFSVFAEEWGLIGSLVIVALFFILILRGLNTAEESKDRFGFLLALGISSIFFWHIIINLGMVSGLMPVVGVPLPFMSYGGSFMLTSMTAIGILLSIRMRRFIL